MHRECAARDWRRAGRESRSARPVGTPSIASASSGEISVSAIARAAGVDRTFLHRHADLLRQVHAAQVNPAAALGGGPMVSRASLQADLANAQGQITRQAAQARQLEKKMSEPLGEQVWRESGLGAPADIEQLQRRITDLEQQVVDLRGQVEERDQELDAARNANRELISNLNKRPVTNRLVSASATFTTTEMISERHRATTRSPWTQ